MRIARPLIYAAALGTGTALASTSGKVSPPSLSSTARAHQLTGAYGATPGWSRAKMSPRINAAQPVSGMHGVDVSGYTRNINWPSMAASGTSFAYVKASEGNYYSSSVHDTQLSQAWHAGLTVGSYHFANPASSSGASQADYFVAHGGGWRSGLLPGAVDMEWNPYTGSNSCYGKSPADMTAWIADFQGEYLKKTGVYPVIYTATAWWNSCVSNDLASHIAATRSSLWLANYSSTAGAAPAGWYGQRIWQYGSVTSAGYDVSVFSGSYWDLKALSIGGR